MSLRVQDLWKSFPGPRGPRPVLQSIGFEVPAGELHCLLGPNGSGKTTLLKSIATLLIPERGRVLAGTLDVHRHPEAAKRLIGFCSTEDQSFYGRLTGRVNLWFYARLHGLSEPAFADRLRDLDRLLDLDRALDRPFRELSSGLKQRFLLARAALHDPPILLLDEPQQNLDPRYAARLREVLREEWAGRRGKTVLISTHHLEDARRLTDRWVVLAEGRVRFAGSLAGEPAADADLEAFFAGLTESPS